MSSEVIQSNPMAWRARLKAFVAAHRTEVLLPDGHMLDGLHDWQRRITGGALLQFLEWAASDEAHARYPDLGKNPITERVFVCITDLSGAVAYREIIDEAHDHAIRVDREEWAAFLEDPAQHHDDDFVCHWEFWSVWHRELDTRWEIEGIESIDPETLWVHEEGFALLDGAGRGSRHLWRWDGEAMHLVAQDVTKWID